MNNKTTYKIGDVVKVIDDNCYPTSKHNLPSKNNGYFNDGKLHLRNILKDGSLGKGINERYRHTDKDWEGEKGKVVSINEDVNGKKYIVGFYPHLRKVSPHPYFPSLSINGLDESSYIETSPFDTPFYDYDRDNLDDIYWIDKYEYEVYKNGIECSPSNIQLVDDNLLISEKEELISRRKEQLEMKKKEIEQLTKELEQMKSLV